MLKILKNDEKVIFRIKGNNSVYIMNDKLKYISPIKVSKGSECVKVSLTHLKIKENQHFLKKVHIFLCGHSVILHKIKCCDTH